jgi:hypothetical protein
MFMRALKTLQERTFDIHILTLYTLFVKRDQLDICRYLGGLEVGASVRHLANQAEELDPLPQLTLGNQLGGHHLCGAQMTASS